MKKLFVILLIISIVLFITDGNNIKNVLLESFSDTYTTIIPTLFLFAIIGRVLVDINGNSLLGKFAGKPICRLLRIPETVAGVYILSILTSYPIGAVTVCNLVKNKNISPEYGEEIIGFCNNTGPGFAVGVLGGVFWNDYRIGVIIYVSQIISSILVGVFLLPKNKHNTVYVPVTEELCIGKIPVAVSSSALTVLEITANIGFFKVVIYEITKLFNNNAWTNVILYTISEITEGCRTASMLGGYIGIFLSGFTTAFGGISVILQIMNSCIEVGINLKKYIIFKTVCGFVCGITVTVIYIIMYRFC